MPKGVFFTKNKIPEPAFHSYLLTREDGSRVYGCVLTFYEKMENPNICSAMFTLCTMYEAESHSPSRQSTALTINIEDSDDPSSTPISYEQAALSERHSTPTKPDYVGSFEKYDPESDVLFVAKCLCLVMQHPFVSAAKSYLLGLLDICLQESELDLMIESYIYNILYEVPPPPPGRTMRFTCSGNPVTVQNPTLDELPLFDYSMKEVILTLGIENVVDLFTCVLLEHQILMVSAGKLMLCLCMLSVLFIICISKEFQHKLHCVNICHFLSRVEYS